MNFKFKLEAVRKQRRRVVDALSRDLAEAETRIGLIQERLASLDEDIHSQIAPAGSGSSHQIQVADLIAKTAWLDHLRRLRRVLMDDLSQAQRETDAVRNRLSTAWKEMEILNNLRDRQKNHWLQALLGREQKELDEIGNQRAHRDRMTDSFSWEDPRLANVSAVAENEGWAS